MPVKIYACTCGGSENTARQILKSAKVADWLKVPVTKGKNRVAAEMEKLPQFVRNSAQFKALKGMLTHKSRFVVFLGYSTAHEAVIWADVASGKFSEKLDGQAIVEKYYKLP